MAATVCAALISVTACSSMPANATAGQGTTGPGAAPAAVVDPAAEQLLVEAYDRLPSDWALGGTWTSRIWRYGAEDQAMRVRYRGAAQPFAVTQWLGSSVRPDEWDPVSRRWPTRRDAVVVGDREYTRVSPLTRTALRLHGLSRPPQWVSRTGEASWWWAGYDVDDLHALGVGYSPFLQFSVLTATPGPSGSIVISGRVDDGSELRAEIDALGRFSEVERSEFLRTTLTWTTPTVTIPDDVDNRKRSVVEAERAALELGAHWAWRANNQDRIGDGDGPVIGIASFLHRAGIRRDRGDGVRVRTTDIRRGIRLTFTVEGYRHALVWRVVGRHGIATYRPVAS